MDRNDLKTRLSQYFVELDFLQNQVRERLDRQQICLAAPDARELNTITQELALAVEQLEAMVNRRAELLNYGQSLGISAATLHELAAQIDDSDGKLVATTQQLKLKINALNHAGYSQWVVCQKSHLHYGQLIQLIANGGRRPRISSTGKQYVQGGAILDASV